MAHKENQFLSDEDFQDFSQKGRFFNREICFLELPDILNLQKTKKTFKFESQIGILTTHTGQIRDSRLVYFEVAPDDGLSWLAQRAYTLIWKKLDRKKIRNVEIKTIYRHPFSKGSPPMIFGKNSLIEPKKFVKIARKHHLGGKPFLRTKNTFQFALWIFLALSLQILNIGIQHGFKQFFANLDPGLTYFKSFEPYLLGGLAIVITYFNQLYSVNKIIKDNSEALQKLSDELSILEEGNSRNYFNFVDDCAKEIYKKLKNCIVILDNYSNLDPTTKLILKKYLFKYYFSIINKKDKKVNWVIIDLKDTQNFTVDFTASVIANSSIKDRILRISKLFKVNYLNAVDKEKLIKILGAPLSNKNHLKIKWICKSQTIDEKLRARLISTFGPNTNPSLEERKLMKYFYILAIGSFPSILPVS